MKIYQIVGKLLGIKIDSKLDDHVKKLIKIADINLQQLLNYFFFDNLDASQPPE